MRILQNAAISPPDTEFLVAFSINSRTFSQATRRTVVVLADTPTHAKKICKQRYPRGLHLQVFAHPPRPPADRMAQHAAMSDIDFDAEYDH